MQLSEAKNNIISTRAEIQLEISRSGLSCLWEAGGSYTNTGRSQIICDRFGNAKRAIYVPTRGDLCNGGHALIPVVAGDIVVSDEQHRGNHEIFVWEIIRIKDGKATLELLEYSCNRIICEEQVYSDAVTAAMLKASDYHCRSVYYAR